LERKATGKVILSSSTQCENEALNSNISRDLQVEETLKQEIYQIEVLNRHLKQENEAVKA